MLGGSYVWTSPGAGRPGPSISLQVMLDNSKLIDNDNSIQLVVKKLVVICTHPIVPKNDFEILVQKVFDIHKIIKRFLTVDE
jgi:hypothetical protein